MKLKELSVEKRAEVTEVLEANGAPTERVVEVYFADEDIVNVEARRIQDRDGLGFLVYIPIFWPYLLLFTLLLSPCGVYQAFIAPGVTKLRRKMRRTLCILTNKSLIVSQRKLNGPETNIYRYWGIIGVSYPRGFIAEKFLVIPLETAAVSRIRGSMHAVHVSSEGPPATFYCRDAQSTLAAINQARNRLQSPTEAKAIPMFEGKETVPVDSIV